METKLSDSVLKDFLVTLLELNKQVVQTQTLLQEKVTNLTGRMENVESQLVGHHGEEGIQEKIRTNTKDIHVIQENISPDHIKTLKNSVEILWKLTILQMTFLLGILGKFITDFFHK